MRTRYAYLWTGLQTCAMLSANSTHTICHEPKFVDFFVQTQRELGAPGVLCSPPVRGKLIYHSPSENCLVRLRVLVFRRKCYNDTQPAIWAPLKNSRFQRLVSYVSGFLRGTFALIIFLIIYKTSQIIKNSTAGSYNVVLANFYKILFLKLKRNKNFFDTVLFF